MSRIKSKIGRCIPFSLKLFLRFLQRFYQFVFQRNKLQVYDGGGYINDVIKSTIDKIIIESSKGDDIDIKKLERDIILCYLFYGFTPLDFYLFNFHIENSSWKSRRTFVSDVYKDYKLFWKEGADSYLELYDKYRFYEKTKKYFNREVMFVNEHTKESDFIEFTMRVRNLFIKSNSDSYGRGAFAMMVNTETDAKKLFEKVRNKSYIVEERLYQISDMGQWNDSSLNTVRVNTYLTDKGFYVLAPFMRTGRKGSIVDNGGAGGVFASIDVVSGEIITDGFDEYGTCYPLHPDSGIPYKGEKIPEWKSLLKLAEEIHSKCMSNHIYIGWDFAYTERGWTLVEGNRGQFICQQTSTKRGFKPNFDYYMSGNAINK